MPERAFVDRLDDAIQAMFAAREAPLDRELESYVSIARTLRSLPRPSFKARLRIDLEGGTKMTVTTEPRPAVLQTATPRLRVRKAAAAIEFYVKAFGAREVMRFSAGGHIPHAELAIGNSIVVLSDEAPEHGFPGPEALGGSPVGMHLYVDNADAWVDRAVAAGARLITPVSDQFYGDRSGTVADPFGYSWTIATRKEDLSVDEMQRRMAAMEAQRMPRESPTFMPKGFRTVTPYLVVEDAPALIDFTRRVFDAELRHQSSGSGGGIHAEVLIGDSMVMIGGGAEGRPLGRPGNPTALHVYVEDTDAVYQRALAAGASSIGAPVDQEVRGAKRRGDGRRGQRLVHRHGKGRTSHPGRAAHRERLSPSSARRAINRVHATGVRCVGCREIRVARGGGTSRTDNDRRFGGRDGRSAWPVPADADNVLPVCPGRRRIVLACAPGRRHIDERTRGPAFWRSGRQCEGRVRESVESGDAAPGDTLTDDAGDS